MKKGKMLKFSGVLLVGSFLLAACGGAKEEVERAEEAPAKAIQLMSESELTTLDTASMLDFPDAITQVAAFEGLYTLDENDQVIPAAAKELPEISEDGTVYTIKLREDGKWSNGDPVTAHDFEYAWKKVANPSNAFVYSFLIQETIENGVAVANGEKELDELGVKAMDDYTLEVRLLGPKPFFTSLMTFPTFLPQNQKAVEEFGDTYGTAADKVVYNGPFVVENWTQADMNWDLVKNEDYWDKENVKSDAIHYEVIKEGSTALNLYEDGQLDVAYLSGTLAKMNTEHEDYQAYPTATLNYIRLNQERNGKQTPLANENLRKAFALGIDKENIINNVISDGSVPLNGFITKGFVKNPETGADFREDAGDLMAFDEEKAQEYWQQAKQELGDTVELELMVNDSDSYKKLAESIQGELEKRFDGLKINFRSLPTETALNLARESDYDMFLIYWTPDYQDPISTLNMLHSKNAMNYENPTYDKMLDDASTTLALDPTKRWEKLIAAEKEAIETTAATIVISQNQQSVLQNPAITGLNFHTFGAPLTLKNIEYK